MTPERLAEIRMQLVAQGRTGGLAAELLAEVDRLQAERDVWPIKPGDRVTLPMGPGGIVLFVYSDFAWVLWDGHGRPISYRQCELVPAPPAAGGTP